MQLCVLNPTDKQRHNRICHTERQTKEKAIPDKPNDRRSQKRDRNEIERESDSDTVRKKQKQHHLSTDKPKLGQRIEVLLMDKEDLSLGWWRGTVHRISSQNDSQFCVYFDDGDAKWYTWPCETDDDSPWRVALSEEQLLTAIHYEHDLRNE